MASDLPSSFFGDPSVPGLNNAQNKVHVCLNDADCGFGKCIGNGTACLCASGYQHDQLLTLYSVCDMPSAAPLVFAVSFVGFSVILLAAAFHNLRIATHVQSQVVYATSLFALVASVAFGVCNIIASTKPNPITWALYFLMMALHMCGLIPLVSRQIIPPAFYMIFMYPRWFDISIVAFVSFASCGLVYTWIFSMIALSYGNIAMYNDGVTIWFGVCALLGLFLTTIVILATRQLIAAINSMLPAPFYRDLDVLASRARRFQIVALVFGGSSSILLVLCTALHFGNGGAFHHRYIITWVLLYELLALDAVIIWISRAGSSKNVLSIPKSNLVVETEEASDHGSRGRLFSFVNSAELGLSTRRRASSLVNNRRTSRGSSKDVVDIAVV